MLNKKGFTMIEIIVVTLIIATLALLVAPSFKNSTMTADIEKAKIGLVELNTAVKLYYEVNPSGNISGIFNNNTYQKLTKTVNNDAQGYTYLHNAARWEQRSNGSYSLKGINCKYNIGAIGADETTSVECIFKDDNKNNECYKFSINKNNPAVVKRQILDLENGCANM